MATDKSSFTPEEPRLRKIFRDDFRRKDLKKTLKRDFSELREFYLNENRKKQLEQMGWFNRGFFTFAWLIKSLFLKLTPLRRIMLLTSIIFLFMSRSVLYHDKNIQFETNFAIFGGIILLFLLMLELKDKLLARSELEAGHSVQNALMPQRTPSVPGWSLWLYTKTANEVGGDLVDFQKLTENRFGVSLADVSGKGLTAALLMAKLQSTIRALSPDVDSLTDLGVKINKIFYQDSLRKLFASLVYLEIRSDSKIVHILNAGHIPPLTVKNNKIEEMQKGDPAIGILPSVKYNEQIIELSKGEILFIYSDGLTDAKNEESEFFGIQRIKDLLTNANSLKPSETGEIIIQKINKFIGSTPLYDDLSVAILKCEQE